MPLYTIRHRPPLPAAPRYDCSMLPDDETVFLVPRLFSNGHPYGGDQTPAPELLDLNQRFPYYNHHHFLSDSTVILNVMRRRIAACGGLSEATIENHIESRVHRHQNDAVWDEDGLCVVCQEELVEENGRIARLDCGHHYHCNCIKKWLNLSNTCPLCKATVLLPSSHN